MSDFHKRKGSKDGRYNQCKNCALADEQNRYKPKTRRRRLTHCTCGVELTDETAYRRTDSGGFRAPCKKCRAASSRRWRGTRVSRRRAQIDRDTCDICGSKETVTRGGKVRLPSLDHCHKTGQWRGLLCSRCNTGLGMFQDHPDLLRAAAEYIEKWKEAHARMNEPVFQLRDGYHAESYWPDEYVTGAVPILERLGFLSRPLTEADRMAAERALEGLHALDLDVTDVHPFGLLWALRSTGAVREVEGLDDQLRGWREWEETDHLANDPDDDEPFFPPNPLGFLPALPA